MKTVKALNLATNEIVNLPTQNICQGMPKYKRAGNSIYF